VLRIVLSLAALAAVALLAVPAVAGAAATRAEYVAQADPLCADANGDIERLNGKFRRLEKMERFRAAGNVLRKTGTRLSVSIRQVRAIPPPPGDEQLIARWLGLIEKVAANNMKMGAAESKQRFGKVERFQRSNDGLHDKAHALVAPFGFSSCA
jgi:hypothetical protein